MPASPKVLGRDDLPDLPWLVAVTSALPLTRRTICGPVQRAAIFRRRASSSVFENLRPGPGRRHSEMTDLLRVGYTISAKD